MRPDTTTPAAGSGASEQKKALLHAFDTVLKTQADEREAERQVAEARRRAATRVRPVVWAGSAIVLFIAAYLWVERPDWVFTPPPAPESLAVKEASLRIALANAAQHVERFRLRTGRLPQTLDEAGAHRDSVLYHRTGTETYQLIGVNGPVRVTLASSDGLPKFLGNSFEVISRRNR
jgi:hypothetical protein